MLDTIANYIIINITFFSRARELFEKIIYHNPNFVGIDKVHFRLALIFKEQENYLKSKKVLKYRCICCHYFSLC